MPTQACLLPLESDVELLALVESLSPSGGSSQRHPSADQPSAAALAGRGLGAPVRPATSAAAAPESPTVQLLRGFLELQLAVKGVVALDQVSQCV